MSNASYEETDLIQELRLRKWARKHYVAAEDRNDEDWHPVVLDEMRRKDAEIPVSTFSQMIVASYVPLAPTISHIIHQGHTDRTQPTVPRQTTEISRAPAKW